MRNDKAFIEALLDVWLIEGVLLKGKTVQALLLEHGQVREEKFDPQRHEARGFNAKPGAPWLVVVEKEEAPCS